MEVLNWFDIAWRVIVGGFLALLPGLIFWLTVLGLFLLIRRVGRALGAKGLEDSPEAV